MMPDLAVHGLFMVYAIAFLMSFATIFTWVERKLSAIMADRIGANRAYIRIPFTQVKLVAWGLFHGLADGAKMLLKENFTPNTYDRLAYQLAPWIAAVPVLLVFAVVPFGGTLMPGHLLSADWFPDLSQALSATFGDRAIRCRWPGSMPASCSCWRSPASASWARCWPAGRRTTSSRCWVPHAPPRR